MDLNKILSFVSITILIHFTSLAQQTGPTSPDFMGFESMEGTNMVNINTGDFVYNIPLMYVPGPQGGYPITLSYSAGIGVAQDATWVGLGWRLNVGSLNRVVNQTADDMIKEVHSFSAQYASLNYQTLSLSHTFPNGLSIARTHAWGDNKSTNWSLGTNILSFNFDENLSIGIDPSFYLESNLRINAGINLSSGETSFGLRSSGITSLGVSMSSRGGVGLNLSVVGNNLLANSNLSFASNTRINTQGFFIPIPTKLGVTTVGYKRIRINHENISNHNLTYFGSLTEDFDEGIAAFDKKNKKTRDVLMLEKSLSMNHNYISDEHDPVNLLPAYDKFIGSAQGLSVPFNFRHQEFGSLYSFGKYLRKNNQISSQYTEPSISNHYSSSNWKIKPSSYKLPEDHSIVLDMDEMINDDLSTGSIFVDQTEINYTDHNYSNILLNQDYINNRFGSFIINKFTNYEINNTNTLALLNKGFIESKNISSRSNVNFFPSQGIGAFSITSPEGITYHYSLPVYQFESIYHQTVDNPDNESSILSFESSVNPYAINWLLTGITGPDYVDVNNNGISNEDYGYWIEFKYDKFSNCYPWNSVLFYKDERPGISEKLTASMFGFKDIYYLNSIKTKTHTAFFIKGDRKDGLGSSSKFYYDYATEVATNSMEFRDRAQVKYPKITDHKLLKLDKIVLYKNDNLPNIEQVNHTTSNSSYIEENTTNGLGIEHFNYTEKKLGGFLDKVFNTTSFDLPANSVLTNLYSNSKVTNVVKTHDRPIQIYSMDNVLDHLDYQNSLSEIDSKAIKSVDFKYSSELMKGMYNSNYSDFGVLTLTEISERTLNNKTKPSRLFNYNNFDDFSSGTHANVGNAQYQLTTNFVHERNTSDTWGFLKGADGTANPSNWSLNRIISPLGHSLNIEYESDIAVNEYALSNDLRYEITKVSEKWIPCVTNEVQDGFLTNWDFHFSNRIEGQTFIIGNTYNLNLKYLLNSDIQHYDYRGECDPITPHTAYFENIQLQSGSYDLTIPIKVEDLDISKNTIQVSTVSEDHIKYFNTLMSKYKEKPDLFEYLSLIIKGEHNVPHKGGGLRVKEINRTDGISTYRRMFNYLDNNLKETGYTSYIPKHYFIPHHIPYKQLIPTPQVLYATVNIMDYGNNDELISHVRKNYNVPKTCENCMDENYELNGFLKVTPGSITNYEREYQATEISPDTEYGEYEQLYTANRLEKYQLTQIYNNLTSIGIILDESAFNKYGTRISSKKYTYETDDNSGVILESFFNTKYSSFNDENIISTMLTKHFQYSQPLLKNVVTKNGRISNKTTFKNYDLLLGIARTILTENSFGDKYYTKNVYAHEVYPEMGSKHINSNNKNMLTQEAGAYLYKDNGDNDYTNDPVVDASITTWKKHWDYREFNNTSKKYENIDFYPPGHVNAGDDHVSVWRKHSTYSWRNKLQPGTGFYLGSDGNLFNSDDEFDFVTLSNNHINWVQNSEVTLYDHWSNPIESKDVNGNYMASKQWNHKTTSSVVGASISNYAASGMEELQGEVSFYNSDVNNKFFESEVILGQYADLSEDSHTGKYSAKVSQNGTTAIKAELDFSSTGYNPNDYYTLQIWVKNVVNAQNVHFSDPSMIQLRCYHTYTGGFPVINVSPTITPAGDWSLLTFTFKINNLSSVANYTGKVLFELGTSLTAFTGGLPKTYMVFDDFKLHPASAGVSSYVYDEQDRISAVLDGNNIATKYVYNNKGQLESVWSEKIGLDGGFVKTSEQKMRYIDEID
jgi:hypothetical protein